MHDVQNVTYDYDPTDVRVSWREGNIFRVEAIDFENGKNNHDDETSTPRDAITGNDPGRGAVSTQISTSKSRTPPPRYNGRDFPLSWRIILECSYLNFIKFSYFLDDN